MQFLPLSVNLFNNHFFQFYMGINHNQRVFNVIFCLPSTYSKIHLLKLILFDLNYKIHAKMASGKQIRKHVCIYCYAKLKRCRTGWVCHTCKTKSFVICGGTQNLNPQGVPLKIADKNVFAKMSNCADVKKKQASNIVLVKSQELITG